MSKAKSSINSDDALLQAVAEGDLATIKTRIAAGADVNAAPKNQIQAIFQAVGSGKVQVVQTLLDAGANVNVVGYPHRGANVKSTPLCYAIERNDQSLVKFLLNAGADIAIETHSANGAVAMAVEQSCKAFHQFNAAEADWFGKKRSPAMLARAKADSEYWLQFVREAIQKGVNVRDYALWQAVNCRHNEMALLLISAGVNPDAAPHITSVLNRSIEHGDTSVALALLKAGASVRPANGPAPLLIATKLGQLSVVPALLDAGAEINAAGDLQIGGFGPEEVKEESVAGGAIVIRTTNVPNPPIAEAGTSLIVATRLGNKAMVKLLVEHGADLNIGDKHGISALSWAIKLGNSEITDLLRNAGAAEPKDLEGAPNTALWTAALKGDVTRAKVLLRQGAKPNDPVEDREGKHLALVAAARGGHLEVVDLLLKHGAEVNLGACEKWSAGITPLMVAAHGGHLKVLQTLIAAKANLEAKDKSMDGGGETALHYAARGGHAKVIEMLAKAGAKINAKAVGGSTPLLVAVGERQHDAVKTLLALKADPNVVPSVGGGPLVAAAQQNDFALVKLLMEYGATPNSARKKPDFLPLAAAASENAVKIVRHLLAAGAEVNAQGITGNTALADATLFGHEGIVEILLTSGADPNLPDREGFTPLMGAVISGRVSIVSRLLEAGARANAVAADGRTAIKLARENRQRKILPLLEAAAKKLPAPKPPKAKAIRKAQEDERAEDEGPDFTDAATRAPYQDAVAKMEKLSGAKAVPLNDQPGGYTYAVNRDAAETLLASHHVPFLKVGAYLLRSQQDHTGRQEQLALLPTRDWADVLRTFQTNGANYGLGPGAIVKWLQNLALQQPFILTGAGVDWLEGQFTSPVTNARKVAKQMQKFCPDIVDQGVGSVSSLAKALEKEGYFFFWWD